jgi:hypothetical protein
MAFDTSRWISAIDEITAAFQKEFGHLSGRELNLKPEPNTWSVAQNIEHLININKSYYPIIGGFRDGKYKLSWLGKIDFMVNFFGSVVLNSVQPSRRRKMKTFPLWEPSKNDIDGDIVEKFAVQQEDLKKLINESQDLLEKNAVISSPANKNIVYKLETAFDIIVTHERRHFEQARETKRFVLSVN